MVDSESVRVAYDRFSGVYDKSWAVYIRRHKEWLDQNWPAHCPEDGGVLDLGCGTGWALAHLSQTRPDLTLTGVNFSEEMLKLSRKAVPSAELLCGDITDPDFFVTLPKSDIVLSIGILHHFTDMDAHLRDLSRLTASGGTAFLSTFALEGEMMRKFDKLFRKKLPSAYNEILPHAELTEKLHDLYPDAEIRSTILRSDGATRLQCFILKFDSG